MDYAEIIAKAEAEDAEALARFNQLAADIAEKEGLDLDDARKKAAKQEPDGHRMFLRQADDNLRKAGNAAVDASDSRLEEMAKAHAREHGVTLAKAYDEVLATEPGREAYAQQIETRRIAGL